jgi:hypothetical protein
MRVRTIKASSALDRLALLETLGAECGVVNAFHIYTRALSDLCTVAGKTIFTRGTQGSHNNTFPFHQHPKIPDTFSHEGLHAVKWEITWPNFQVTMSNMMGVLDTTAVLVENFRHEFAKSIISDLGELCSVLEQYRSTLNQMIGQLSDPPLSDLLFHCGVWSSSFGLTSPNFWARERGHWPIIRTRREMMVLSRSLTRIGGLGCMSI